MAASAPTEDVYCTLCLTDSYLPGAAVLAKSLRDAGTQKKLACLVNLAFLRDTTVTELRSLYNYVINVDLISNPLPANLYLLGRPDLQYTFTKLQLWSQTQFRKIVYIDADVVALRAPDELFDLPHSFAAAPDVGWPDAFNTGVMVLSPNTDDYWNMRQMAAAGESFDGADQGLINQYYQHRPWHRLSFTYNCTPSGHYQYEPAYRFYGKNLSMVHFIGPDKPWRRGRHAADSPEVFQQLLDRWWAVWDRHFHVSINEYIYGRPDPIQAPSGETPQQHPHQQQQAGPQSTVNHYNQPSEPAYYATGYPVETTQPAPPPEAMPVSTDPQFSDPQEPAESISHGHTAPPPTAEVRVFAAPHMEWDATRSAPPAQSRPEAASLEVQNYEFNYDPEPFRPPPAYPEPPKDMWYEVPKEPPKKKTEKLEPIFPWERLDRPAPTRRFVDDVVPPPPEDVQEEAEIVDTEGLEVHADGSQVAEPATPAIRVNDESPWAALGTVTRNAWDEIAGIDSYVRALTAYQKNRGRPQSVASPSAPPPVPTSTDVTATAEAVSPTETAPRSTVVQFPSPAELVNRVKQRRESLILTDFPTAAERPSLPVTPAPIRRSTFWGGESEEVVERNVGEDEAALPPAEGVPNQADWNPVVQLEQLRRNSLLVEPNDLLASAATSLPGRELPASATDVLSPSDSALSYADINSFSERAAAVVASTAILAGRSSTHQANTSSSSSSGTDVTSSTAEQEEEVPRAGITAARAVSFAKEDVEIEQPGDAAETSAAGRSTVADEEDGSKEPASTSSRPTEIVRNSQNTQSTSFGESVDSSTSRLAVLETDDESEITGDLGFGKDVEDQGSVSTDTMGSAGDNAVTRELAPGAESEAETVKMGGVDQSATTEAGTFSDESRGVQEAQGVRSSEIGLVEGTPSGRKSLTSASPHRAAFPATHAPGLQRPATWDLSSTGDAQVDSGLATMGDGPIDSCLTLESREVTESRLAADREVQDTVTIPAESPEAEESETGARSIMETVGNLTAASAIEGSSGTDRYSASESRGDASQFIAGATLPSRTNDVRDSASGGSVGASGDTVSQITEATSSSIAATQSTASGPPSLGERLLGHRIASLSGGASNLDSEEAYYSAEEADYSSDVMEMRSSSSANGMGDAFFDARESSPGFPSAEQGSLLTKIGAVGGFENGLAAQSDAFAEEQQEEWAATSQTIDQSEEESLSSTAGYDVNLGRIISAEPSNPYDKLNLGSASTGLGREVIQEDGNGCLTNASEQASAQTGRDEGEVMKVEEHTPEASSGGFGLFRTWAT